MDGVPNETQEKLNQLQGMEHSLQTFLSQKQQFQSQLMEIESALEQLKTTDQAYKIVGNVMLAASQDDLSKDLAEKRTTITLRIKSIEKQEDSLRKKTSELQEEVLKTMK